MASDQTLRRIHDNVAPQRACASLLQHVSAAGLDVGSHDAKCSCIRESFNHAQANLSLRHSVSFFFDLLPAVPLPPMNLRVMVCLPFISAKDFASHPEASLGTRFRLSPSCFCFRIFFHAFIALTPSFSIDGVSTKTSKNDVIHECERYGKVISCSLRKCVISSILSFFFCVFDELFRSYALVEFKHSDDAKYAFKKLDGVRIDGSKWLIDPADVKDFKYFDWTPSSSVYPPQSLFFFASAVGKTFQRCVGSARDDISIRLSTTFAVFLSTHTWDQTSLDV